jgi:hypothetical protein
MSADTQITIYGLWHLEGQTVTAYIGGLDCGDYTVAVDGSIIVPYGVANGLFTPGYLQVLSGTYGGSNHDVTFNVDSGGGPVSVTVPVLCGLNYTSQGQLVRPMQAADLKLQTGIGLGATRRGFEYSLLVQNCVTLQVGTDLSTAAIGTVDTDTTLSTAQFTSDGGRTPELALNATQPFSGVHWGTLQDDYTFDGMLAWQIARPSPGSVLAAAIYLNDEDR